MVSPNKKVKSFSLLQRRSKELGLWYSKGQNVVSVLFNSEEQKCKRKSKKMASWYSSLLRSLIGAVFKWPYASLWPPIHCFVLHHFKCDASQPTGRLTDQPGCGQAARPKHVKILRGQQKCKRKSKKMASWYSSLLRLLIGAVFKWPYASLWPPIHCFVLHHFKCDASQPAI